MDLEHAHLGAVFIDMRPAETDEVRICEYCGANVGYFRATGIGARCVAEFGNAWICTNPECTQPDILAAGRA